MAPLLGCSEDRHILLYSSKIFSFQGVYGAYSELAGQKIFPDFDITSKPTTIIYPKITGLSPNLLASDGSAAIRIARDKFCKELIQQFGKAIVSLLQILVVSNRQNNSQKLKKNK